MIIFYRAAWQHLPGGTEKYLSSSSSNQHALNASTGEKKKKKFSSLHLLTDRLLFPHLNGLKAHALDQVPLFCHFDFISRQTDGVLLCRCQKLSVLGSVQNGCFQ